MSLESLEISVPHPTQSAARSSKHNPDKARAILAGALEVFTDRGYAAASMDRIAAAAGVSKPTVYSYFQDKEGLFIALIQQLSQAPDRALGQLKVAVERSLPPEVVLRKLASTVLEEFSRNKPLATLMRLIIGESERFPELAQTFVQTVQKPLLEQLSAYFSAQSQLNLSDSMVAARTFAGALVYYIITQEIMHGKNIMPFERDRMIEGLIGVMTAQAAIATNRESQ